MSTWERSSQPCWASLPLNPLAIGLTGLSWTEEDLNSNWQVGSPRVRFVVIYHNTFLIVFWPFKSDSSCGFKIKKDDLKMSCKYWTPDCALDIISVSLCVEKNKNTLVMSGEKQILGKKSGACIVIILKNVEWYVCLVIIWKIQPGSESKAEWTRYNQIRKLNYLPLMPTHDGACVKATKV